MAPPQHEMILSQRDDPTPEGLRGWERVTEHPYCLCWSQESGYRQKSWCKIWRRGQQCQWRCKGGHPVWPGCSKWSETKHIGSLVVLDTITTFHYLALTCIYLTLRWSNMPIVSINLLIQPWWQYWISCGLWSQHRVPLPWWSPQWEGEWAKWQNAERSDMDHWAGQNRIASYVRTEQEKQSIQ